MNWYLQVALVLWILSLVADLATTKAALVGENARELNPIAGPKGERLWLLWIYNVAFPVVVLNAPISQLAKAVLLIVLGPGLKGVVAVRNWRVRKD